MPIPSDIVSLMMFVDGDQGKMLVEDNSSYLSLFVYSVVAPLPTREATFLCLARQARAGKQYHIILGLENYDSNVCNYRLVEGV